MTTDRLEPSIHALSTPRELGHISHAELDRLTHVCHTPRDSCQQSLVGKMNGNVEVGDMSMTPLVKQDVVRFQIPNPISSERHVRNPPMDYAPRM